MCLTNVVGQRLVIDLRTTDLNSPSRINDCIAGAENHSSQPGSPVVGVARIPTTGNIQEVVGSGGLKFSLAATQTVDNSNHTVIAPEEKAPSHISLSYSVA